MLNFRNTNFFFAIVLIALIFCDVRYINVSWGWYVALLVIYLLIQFWGSYFVQSNFYMKVHYRGNTTRRWIALSFDDSPQENYTAEVLDILKEKNVKATFFCIGENILRFPELVKRMYEEGHIIGNHSYSHHTWFDLFTVKKMVNEIESTNDIVRQQLGITMQWFRPPYGVTNPSLSRAVKKTNMQAIGWNIRSYDTMFDNAEDLLEKLKKMLQPGGIILLHDKMLATKEMLSSFIDYVKTEGYEIVSMDKILDLKPYA